MRRIKKDRKGVAGFFLDLPVIMLISIIILLFISTTSHIYFTYEEETKERKLEDVCLNLHEEAEICPDILWEDNNGLKYRHFSIQKLDNFNKSKFENKLNIRSSFSYNITIKKLDGTYKYVIGEKIPDSYRGDVSTYISPITLHDSSNGNEYIGSMSTMVWDP